MSKLTVVTRRGEEHTFEGDNVAVEIHGDSFVRVFEYTPYKLLGVFSTPDSVIKE